MNTDAPNFENKLIEWSVRNSGYDEHRDYIGLSTIGDCPRLIYHRYFNRTGISTEGHLKTRYNYEVEENIKNRLRQIGAYSPGKEISIHNGLVKGHTDGEISGCLLEIKTVPQTKYLPTNYSIGISEKIYWQIQAYMLYGQYAVTLMIYFARDYGQFRIFAFAPDKSVQSKIDQKINRLIGAIRDRKVPSCECGRCEEKKR